MNERERAWKKYVAKMDEQESWYDNDTLDAWAEGYNARDVEVEKLKELVCEAMPWIIDRKYAGAIMGENVVGEFNWQTKAKELLGEEK